jgi:uncharacterized linocin/CFP29 family protein
MVIEIFSPTKLVILDSLSIGYISGQAKGGTKLMRIEIEGADAIKVAQDILDMEGVQGSYEVISEEEKEGTLATIATIIGIISGTIAIAEKLYQLKRKIDSPETPKIERVLIVSKNGDRLLLKDATLEQLQKLLEQEKS